MNPESDPVILIKQLDRACRIGCLVITTLFAYTAISLSMSIIDNFEQIFRDMLNGQDLPWLTRLVIGGKSIYLMLSLSLPVIALIIAFRTRRADHAVIGISLCSFGLLLLSIFIWSGLSQAFFTVVANMSGA